MIVEVRDGRTVVVKRATAHETAVLRAAAHPGVVEVLDADAEDGELVTALAGSRTFDPAGPDAPTALAALAATVADLHELGIVHGRIEPGHVVMAPDGHPVLCGFADGGFVRDGADPAADVSALAGLVRAVAESVDDADLRRRLDGVADRAATGSGSARAVAAALQVAVGGERRRPPRMAQVRPTTGRLLAAGAAAFYRYLR